MLNSMLYVSFGVSVRLNEFQCPDRFNVLEGYHEKAGLIERMPYLPVFLPFEVIDDEFSSRSMDTEICCEHFSPDKSW